MITESSKIVFEKHENPQVSIVISVYNKWNYTYSCLNSIYKNTKNVSYEIIIADDGSVDKTIDIRNYVDNIKVVRNDKNLGSLFNCNNAAKYANGKYILFLNNDMNVQQNWLKELVNLIENNDDIGMVGSKLVYTDKRLKEAGGIVWNDGNAFNYGRFDNPENPQYNYVKEVDYITGECIMIRTSLWEKIGGFDKRYRTTYYEDTDLAFEVRKQGYRVVYNPKSVVIHFEGVSHGTNTRYGIKSYQLLNQKKFLKKWKDVLQKDHFSKGKDFFYARDRSKNKKVVLVIDYMVPEYDQHAGGRCTFNYLKLFSEMGFKVIFIGDNSYKNEPYTSELQKMGIEVLYRSSYMKNINSWIKKNSNYIDYVYLNRPDVSIKYIDLIKNYTHAKIIYFAHDLHYLRELRNYEIDKNKQHLYNSDNFKKIEFDIVNKSDVVYVVSSYEKEILKQEFPNKIIRNIPVYVYDNINNMDNNAYEDRKNILFVGGFNHTPNVDGVTWFYNNILPIILNKIPNVKFYIVGSNPPNSIKKLQSENVIVTGYVTDEKLNTLYEKCRLVVAPLRYGAGVKGKVVEAIYNQVPLVTTSIGAEGLINIEKYAMITDVEKEFANKVIELYTNKNKWIELSELYNKYIENYFSKKAALEIVSIDFNKQ